MNLGPDGLQILDFNNRHQSIKEHNPVQAVCAFTNLRLNNDLSFTIFCSFSLARHDELSHEMITLPYHELIWMQTPIMRLQLKNERGI